MSYIIHIGSTADTSGIDKETSALGRATEAANEFVSAIKAGVGIDIGGRIVGKLSEIPGMLEQAVARGVQFNNTLETTQSAVAAVLEKFQGMGKSEAMAAAGTALDELKRQAVKAPGTIQQLSQAWLASAGAATAANIPINSQIDLMVRLSQAVSRLGLPQEQLIQETRALLTGNITMNATLAKTLGITNQNIEAAKEQGDLYGFLVGKIGALGEASDTLDVRWSNFNDTLDQTLGKVTEPIFDNLRDSILDLTKATSDPRNVQQLQALGFEVASLVKGGAALTEWAIKNAPALALVAKGVGLLTIALASIKIAQIVTGLVQWTAGLGGSKSAIDQETAALARNTAGQATNAAARGANAAAAVAGSAAGAGQLYSGYKAARGMGYSAQEALVYSRSSLGAGSRNAAESALQSKSIIDANNALVGLKNEAGGAATGLKRLLPTGVGTAGQAIGAISIVAVAHEIAEAIKSAQRADYDSALAQGNDRLKQFSDFAKRAGNVSTASERDALVKQINDLLESGGKEIAPYAKGLNDMVERLRGRSDLPAADQSGKTQKAQQEQEAADARRNENVAWSIADSKARETARRKKDNEDVYSPEQVDDRIKALRAIQAQNNVPDTSAPNFKEASQTVTEIRGEIEDLVEKRKELVKAAADKEKKDVEEEKKLRIEGLKEQLELLKSQGELRLAQSDEIGGTELAVLKRRKAIEDEIAAKRLGLENQIGSIEEESDTVKQARLLAAKADQMNRDHALKKTVTDNLTKEGDIYSGTNTRRGIGESDAMHESALNLAPGQSLLQQYKDNQSRPVGAINGKSILADNPAASVDAQGNALANKSGSSGSGVADAAKEAANASQEAGKEASGAVRDLGSTVVAALTKIASDAATTKAQVAALINKV